jgi:hypothetical protein
VLDNIMARRDIGIDECKEIGDLCRWGGGHAGGGGAGGGGMGWGRRRRWGRPAVRATVRSLVGDCALPGGRLRAPGWATARSLGAQTHTTLCAREATWCTRDGAPPPPARPPACPVPRAPKEQRVPCSPAARRLHADLAGRWWTPRTAPWAPCCSPCPAWWATWASPPRRRWTWWTWWVGWGGGGCTPRGGEGDAGGACALGATCAAATCGRGGAGGQRPADHTPATACELGASCRGWVPHMQRVVAAWGRLLQRMRGH